VFTLLKIYPNLFSTQSSISIGIRGGGTGGQHVPPPKKINENTKNENNLKIREQSFAEEFSEMGWG